MTYAQVLKCFLQSKKISQAELARRTGMSTAYISQLARCDIKEPTLQKAYVIADCLGVTIDAFVQLMNQD